MATYTVRSGDTWLSLAMKLYGDQRYAKTLRQANRGTTLARGVVIRTGGATYTRPTDINPWGLGAGVVPTSAYETEAGEKLAEKYLGAVGQPTGAPGVTPTEEVPGITPAGEQPPIPVAGFTSMEAYARQQGIELPSETTPVPPPPTTIGEPIDIGALAGAGIGPEPPATPFYPGIAQPEGGIDLAQVLAPPQVTPAEYPPFYPGIPRPELGPTLAPSQVQPGAEYVRPTPAGQVTPVELPPARYPYGTTSAAWYTGQMMREGLIPGAVSIEVADMLGMSTTLLQNSGYVWDEASGLWQHRPEGGGTTTTTGYGGGGRAGRRISFASERRGPGGGQTPYGSSFNSNISGLINWRRGFGG